jgi:molybdate/tungstate transport system substrate-binding protein
VGAPRGEGLGAQENPAQVLPEETLIGRLQSGQLDAGFFYSTEVTDLKMAAIRPAPELQAKASYTLTILSDASNASGAVRFANFLLSAQGTRCDRQRAGGTVRIAGHD